jgi:hypothetical protein
LCFAPAHLTDFHVLPQCRFCGKGFLNGAYLLAHLDRRHADFGPFTATDVALGGEAQGVPEPAVTREMNDLRHEVQMLRSQLDETRTELRSAKQGWRVWLWSGLCSEQDGKPIESCNTARTQTFCPLQWSNRQT